MLEFGVTAKDVITNFTGVVIGKVEYMTGCNQILLSAKCPKAGAKYECQWFDEERVVEVKGRKKITLPGTTTEKKTKGGDVLPATK